MSVIFILKCRRGLGMFLIYRVRGLNCVTFVLKAAADNVH